jgi:hypothetical protein
MQQLSIGHIDAEQKGFLSAWMTFSEATDHDTIVWISLSHLCLRRRAVGNCSGHDDVFITCIEAVITQNPMNCAHHH